MEILLFFVCLVGFLVCFSVHFLRLSIHFSTTHLRLNCLHLFRNLVHIDRIDEKGSKEHLRGADTLLRLCLGSLCQQTTAETVERVGRAEVIVHVGKQQGGTSTVKEKRNSCIT